MGSEADASLGEAPGQDRGASTEQPLPTTAQSSTVVNTSDTTTGGEALQHPAVPTIATNAHIEPPATAVTQGHQNGDSEMGLAAGADMSSGNTSSTSTEPSNQTTLSEEQKASYLASVAYHQPTSQPPAQYATAAATTTTTTTTTTAAAAPYNSSTTTSEPYRTSNGPVQLPSMRTIDHQPQAVHQNLSPAIQYMAQQPMGHLPSNYGLPSEAYGLHNNPRMRLSQGKKEIKRRTKTGCLTCRKRRIKCDEAHPTCNNCRKSKRDCLGYDPIFRPQTVNLVSAYNQLPPDHNSTSDGPPPSQPLVPDSATVNNSYGSQPSSYSHTSDQNGSLPPPTRPEPAVQSSTSIPPNLKQEPRASPHLPIPMGSNSNPEPPLMTTTSTPAAAGYQNNQLHLRASKMSIEKILDLLGPPPPAQQVSHNEEMIHEVTKVYHEMYAGALSAFFETNWYYFSEDGKISFPKDPNLIGDMATFLKILEGIKANDHNLMTYSGALETRIVWQLAKTAASVSEGSNNSMRMTLPPEGDPTEARNRLQVVEALLCGDFLTTNPLTKGLSDNNSHRMRQFDFWYQLGDFVRKPDTNSTPSAAAVTREETLNRMRHLLDGRENRDVLYSIAVVRELSPHFPPDYANTVPQHLDETDPKNRLAVASKFILDESQVTGGTTNVVRRFSDIAARAFIVPGVNIARPEQP